MTSRPHKSATTHNTPQSTKLTVGSPGTGHMAGEQQRPTAAAQCNLQLQQVPDDLLRNETLLADCAGLPHHGLTDAAILEPTQLRLLSPEGPELQGLWGDIDQAIPRTQVISGPDKTLPGSPASLRAVCNHSTAPALLLAQAGLPSPRGDQPADPSPACWQQTLGQTRTQTSGAQHPCVLGAQHQLATVGKRGT